MMAYVESILNEENFFADTVNAPKEGIEQYRKQECLKSAISKEKVYLLVGGKNGYMKGLKTSHRTINKAYAEYK